MYGRMRMSVSVWRSNGKETRYMAFRSYLIYLPDAHVPTQSSRSTVSRRTASFRYEIILWFDQ